ncbi:glycosyltransferase family 4 protein [Thiomicrorhabdus sp. 6S2-11]|uniref:Glycosyltransferase family 4 protein n=1 Tax=Thiomicrorhabdus marina TaxID=2818442 RepID=A0ABS3Q773_9GAMM|nr:glycosyltransferase family 4 protein [Thiomicrorhabdus marina]MBO1927655.1 glycosyltransferase family 4 protein [Thiomicrorhabdus marina]
MKVLHILRSKGIGGAEKYVLNLALALKEIGVESEFAGIKDGWLYRQMLNNGFKVHSLRMKGYFDLASIFRLARILNDGQFNLVHANLMRASFYAKWAVKFAGTRLVMTAHSTNTHKRFSKKHQIIAVSNAVKDNLVAHGFDEDKVHVVLNGVPEVGRVESIDVQRQLRRTLGADDKLTFLMVARVFKDKGHDLMVSALEQLEAGKLAKLQVVVVGPASTEWAQDLKNRSQKLGLPIRWVGQVDQPKNYYQASDILLLPSRREAISLTLLEACSAGLGIIASRTGGIPEVIKHCQNGFLFESENVSELTLAIEQAVDFPDDFNLYGQGALKTFSDGFSIQRNAQQTVLVYQGACNENA